MGKGLIILSNYEYSDSEKDEVFSCQNVPPENPFRNQESSCSTERLTSKAKKHWSKIAGLILTKRKPEDLTKQMKDFKTSLKLIELGLYKYHKFVDDLDRRAEISL